VLSVSESTVRRAVHAGRLLAVEVAGCRRIRTADLAAYVESLAPVNAEETRAV
jgi:excisionase family DNA binding protein